jgi:hypothetical protein
MALQAFDPFDQCGGQVGCSGARLVCHRLCNSAETSNAENKEKYQAARLHFEFSADLFGA